MERFAPALRRVARELDLPRGTRTALLREMAADLEAVYEHHRARGVSEADASRRAEETVLGSSEVIRRLGRLHATPWRGWPEEVGARLSGGLDLVLLAAGVLPVVVLAAAVSVWSLSAGAAPLVWVVLGVGVAMIGVVAGEVLRLVRGRPVRPHRLARLLVLSALAPAVGVLALTLGLHATGIEIATVAGGAATGGAATAGAVAPPAAAGVPQVVLAGRLARDGAALLLGLLLGISGILAWFILVDREARRAAREVDALLAGTVPDPAPPEWGSDSHTTLSLVRRRHG